HLSRFATALFDQLNQVLLTDNRNAAKRDELVLLLKSGLLGRAAFFHQADHRVVAGLKVQDLQSDHVVDFGGQIIRSTSAVSLSYDREYIRAGQRSYFLNLLPRLCHFAIDGHDLVSFANALAI